MCKFPLTVFLQIICKNFSAKLVKSVSLCYRLSKKLNFIKIWLVKVGQNKDLVCYRKKQAFRQCAWGLRQLVLKLWVCRKSQKISTASDQKTTGGSNCPPTPQAGIGLRIYSCCTPLVESFANNFKILLQKLPFAIFSIIQ